MTQVSSKGMRAAWPPTKNNMTDLRAMAQGKAIATLWDSPGLCDTSSRFEGIQLVPDVRYAEMTRRAAQGLNMQPCLTGDT